MYASKFIAWVFEKPLRCYYKSMALIQERRYFIQIRYHSVCVQYSQFVQNLDKSFDSDKTTPLKTLSPLPDLMLVTLVVLNDSRAQHCWVITPPNKQN